MNKRSHKQTNESPFIQLQNGRDIANNRKQGSDKKNKEVDEVLKSICQIPFAPIDEIGATPRVNDMGKTFNPDEMHLPSRHKVSSLMR